MKRAGTKTAPDAGRAFPRKRPLVSYRNLCRKKAVYMGNNPPSSKRDHVIGRSKRTIGEQREASFQRASREKAKAGRANARPACVWGRGRITRCPEDAACLRQARG